MAAIMVVPQILLADAMGKAPNLIRRARTPARLSAHTSGRLSRGAWTRGLAERSFRGSYT